MKAVMPFPKDSLSKPREEGVLFFANMWVVWLVNSLGIIGTASHDKRFEHKATAYLPHDTAATKQRTGYKHDIIFPNSTVLPANCHHRMHPSNNGIIAN